MVATPASRLFVRRRDGRFPLQPFRHRQFLRAQEVRVEQLRLIARAVIGQDGHDGAAAPEFAGETDRARHVDPGRAAHAQALVLEQVEDHRYGFLVRDQIGFVDVHVLDDGRDAPEADALGDGAAFRRPGLAAREQVVHGGTLGVGDADHDVALLLAQIGRRARNGAARADGADEAVDPALGLLPDLRAGRDVMGLAVVEVVPLVGIEHAVRLALAQVVGDAAGDVLVVVGVAVGNRRHLDQLRATQAQHVLLFLALRFRDHDQGAVAARDGDERKADPGVAGGALDHQAAGLDLPAFLGLENDLARRAILHGLAGVHELGLAQDGAAGRPGGALELDERRIADRFDDSVANLHDDGPAIDGRNVEDRFHRDKGRGMARARTGSPVGRARLCFDPDSIGPVEAAMPLTRRKLIGAMARLGGAGAAYETLAAPAFLKPPAAKGASLGLPEDSGAGRSVVMLGAGVAGLAAAHELDRAGYDCIILEAARRPGGRSLTLRRGDVIREIDGTAQECRF